jgi:hypothetical protein
MFWVAPILGAALAGTIYRWLGSEAASPAVASASASR